MEEDTWAQCDHCDIWRLQPPGTSTLLHKHLNTSGDDTPDLRSDDEPVEWTCGDGIVFTDRPSMTGYWPCGDEDGLLQILGGSEEALNELNGTTPDSLPQDPTTPKEGGLSRKVLIEYIVQVTESLPRTPANRYDPATFDHKEVWRDGFTTPFIINAPPQGRNYNASSNYPNIGLQIPDGQVFAIGDVAGLAGRNLPVNVMDCERQQEEVGWTLGDWAQYFEAVSCEYGEVNQKNLSTFVKTKINQTPQKVYNLISLEYSQTSLAKHVHPPSFVNSISWVEKYWPDHIKNPENSSSKKKTPSPKANSNETHATNTASPQTHPQVNSYSLSSLAGSYTDFHADFGGSSVWYHILTGSKTFYIIEPSKSNIQIYENWVCDASSGGTRFLGDLIREAYDKTGQPRDALFPAISKLTINAGETLLLPSGYLHSVYTPVKTLAFGGNFLHSMNIERQLTVNGIESRCKVPKKYRFPFFTEINYFAGFGFLRTVREDGGLESLTEVEKREIVPLIQALKAWDSTRGARVINRGWPGHMKTVFEECIRLECISIRSFIEELSWRVLDGGGSDFWTSLLDDEEDEEDYGGGGEEEYGGEEGDGEEDSATVPPGTKLKLMLGGRAVKPVNDDFHYRGENPALALNLGGDEPDNNNNNGNGKVKEEVVSAAGRVVKKRKQDYNESYSGSDSGKEEIVYKGGGGGAKKKVEKKTDYDYYDDDEGDEDEDDDAVESDSSAEDEGGSDESDEEFVEERGGATVARVTRQPRDVKAPKKFDNSAASSSSSSSAQVQIPTGNAKDRLLKRF